MKKLWPVSLALTCLMPLSAHAEWQGTESVENGVKYVRNPERSMTRMDITLDELWRRGHEADELLFGVPEQILHDDLGNVYVLDSQTSTILVFDADGEYMRTVGREGEGPGEFRQANDMFFDPDGNLGVVIIFPGKLIRMTRDGLPVPNFPLPQDEGGGFQLVFKARSAAGRLVVSGGRQSRDGASRAQLNYLKAFDPSGKELVQYHEMTEATQYGNMKFDEKVFANFKGQWTLAPDGRVAAVLEFDPYRIHVWNPGGDLAFVIERPGYTPLERTAAQKDRFQKVYDGITSWNPNSEFKVSDTHRGISSLQFRDDGSLWVLSGRGQWVRGDGVFATYDVYDTQGRFALQARLLGEGHPADDGVFFAGSRLYRVIDQFSAMIAQFGSDDAVETEDAEDPLAIVAYTIDVPQTGMKR